MAKSPPPVDRQIANFVYGMAEAIDDGDHDRIEALFGDATFQLAGREPRIGGAAFRRTIERSVIHYEGRPCTLHVVTNLQIDVEDDMGIARSKAYVTVFQARPDFPLQPVLTGRYHDEFASTEDGLWHWVARHMQMDHIGDTTHHTNTNFGGNRTRSRSR
jgi:3-phenylpropionate/cinnamic acid dioxygenase small subunit